MKRTMGMLLVGYVGCAGAVRAQEVTLLPPIAAPLAAPVPAPAVRRAGMSLDELIATMLTADPRLRVGSEDINQAIAESITASLRPNPSLGVDGQLLPLRTVTPVDQGGPPQFDAIVSYPIDWFLFGKRKAKMASAAVGVHKSQEEYADLMRLRIREAALVFYDLVEYKALRELARQDVDNLERVDEITRRAVENGGRPTVELNRVRLDLLRSRQLLRDADAAINNAKSRVRALLGRDDTDPGFDVDGSLDLPALAPVMSVDVAMSIAQENRPDLAALRLKVAKAEVDADVARRSAYPGVVVKSGYSRQFQGSIGYKDMDTYLVGVDIGLPFSDRNQGGRAGAASVLAQSHYQVQAGLVDLRSEIEQALNDFRFATQSAQAVAHEELKLAAQVRDAINQAYEAGGQPLLNVLDAQRNYRETYRLYITSRANYWRTSVRLNATLGKKIVP